VKTKRRPSFREASGLSGAPSARVIAPEVWRVNSVTSTPRKETAFKK